MNAPIIILIGLIIAIYFVALTYVLRSIDKQRLVDQIMNFVTNEYLDEMGYSRSQFYDILRKKSLKRLREYIIKIQNA